LKLPLLLLLLIAGAWLYKPGSPVKQSNDFAFYWTAARLAVNGQNPYSPAAAAELEHQVTLNGHPGLVLFNPPWILPLIVGFGLLPFQSAQLLWLVLSVAIMLISVHWLWTVYAPPVTPWIGWLLAATFLPVSITLAIGQISLFALFGVAGFLRFESQNAYLAGASLFLAALKPQLVVLMWAGLACCAFFGKRPEWLAGFLGTLLAASVVTLFIDRQAFQQYLSLVRDHRLLMYEAPTLAGWLRRISGLGFMQYFPLVLAMFWFAREWRRWGTSWVWRERIPALLVVSLAAAPYGWFFDQVLLVPSLFCSASFLRNERRRAAWALAGYAAINLTILAFVLAHRLTFWYSWTAVAWMVLYFYAAGAAPAGCVDAESLSLATQRDSGARKRKPGGTG
jgi:hypothetical protein